MHVGRTSLVAALLLLTGVAAAGTHSITVTDYLNRDWQHEFVSYSLEFPAHACHPNSVALTDAAGKHLPAQLSEVKLWDGGPYVREAALAFVIAKLPALTTQTYTLTFGPKAAAGTPLRGDLHVGQTAEEITMHTSRFGVRVPSGTEAVGEPIAAGALPGPVSGMRLADGTWFGGSSLFGTATGTWKTELTDNGPVFARTRTTYSFTDGKVLTVACRLIAGDYALRIESLSDGTDPERGWQLALNKGVAVADAVFLPGIGKYVKEQTHAVKPADTPFGYLNPWPGDGWFKDCPSALRLRFKDRSDELQLCVVDVDSWSPAPERPPWAAFQPWDYKDIPVMWTDWQALRMPLTADVQGIVRMQADLRQGARKWMVGANRQGPEMVERYQGKRMSVYTALPRLNEVKDLVLAWPEKLRHPALFMDEREMQRVGAYNQDAMSKALNAEGLARTLDTLGYVDMMRSPPPIAFNFDAVMGLGELSPKQRAVMRAQIAYLTYIVKSPLHWSFERGWNSGNPNMTVSRTCNIGLLGCVLLDHPEGRRWATYTADWIDYWLENVVDSAGGWIESSHYARYAVSCMTLFAIAARRAKVRDFFADERFLRLVSFYERTLTPPDPLRHVNTLRLGLVPAYGIRVDAPYGRGTRGDAWEIGGLVARATATSNPTLSRIMQWSWRECGYVEWLGSKTAGQTSLYLNRDLPSAVPDWHSERLPSLGYLLRSEVGSAHEEYLLFVSEYYRSADGEIWPAHTGILAKWFSGGAPIGGAFARMYKHSHPLLENRVLLATNWDPADGKTTESGYVTATTHDGFATLGPVDYVNIRFDVSEVVPHIMRIAPEVPAMPRRETQGEPPLNWRRQILMVRRPGGDGCYLVLRDTVLNEVPTQWHYWMLSEALGTPSAMADRDAVLAARPGHKCAPLRPLTGDCFVAIGQFGRDVDTFVAAPAGTPRYTMRYGTRQSGYGLRQYHEYQDLLHLQRPGAGEYVVAMVPRKPNAPAPTFEPLGDGKVVAVHWPTASDYCFLSEKSTRVQGRKAEVMFDGTSAAVLARPGAVTLALTAPGRIDYREYSLSASVPAALQASPYALTVELGAPASAATEITVSAPGKWRLAEEHTGLQLVRGRGARSVLTLPAGTQRAVLRR